MARRTKRQRVVWLPPDTTNDLFPNVVAAGGLPNGSGFGAAQLSVSLASPIDTTENPLVIDTPRDPATESLADLEDSGYRLRRIVGNIWIYGDRFDEDSGVEEILIEAGIIVRRVDQSGVSLAAIADTAAAAQENTSPAAALNWGDPWIWQRSWILRNPNFLVQTIGLPAVTAIDPLRLDVEYHIDQKTARIIGPEERLFLTVSALVIGTAGQAEITNSTQLRWGVRCLGTPRNSTGNRRNASR